jgi:hypothetical protein
MKKQDSFVDWDFVNIWSNSEGVSSPYLKWEQEGLSNNVRLGSLTVTGYNLEPAFSANTTAYAITVAEDVYSIEFTAVKEDTSASMTINGQYLGNGTSKSVVLNDGTDTPVVIRVTAENGINIRDYTVTVIREVSEKSVYDILFDSSGLVAGVAKPVPITLKAVTVNDEGYDSVRINVSVIQSLTIHKWL